jgi:tetratricopeptide (TPR) repeat protein
MPSDKTGDKTRVSAGAAFAWRSAMKDVLAESDAINFGDVAQPINALLQQGVVAYRTDRTRADALFRQALAAAPAQLPVYFCLYKIHTYLGNLDQAQGAAEAGMAEAARQAGWSPDWQAWTRPAAEPDGAARFALYTLKALAFIHLRQDRPDEARRKLDALKQLDPAGLVGWPVVAALAAGCGETP